MSADPVLYRPDIGPVLIVSGGEGATRRYRAFHHAEQLELAGVPARVAPRVDAALAAEAPRWPLVILHRVAWDGAVQALIDRTRDAGGVALFDVDDLVFEPESTRWHHGVQALPPAEQALYHQGVRRYRRTLLACDGAIVPTEALAARVERAGRPAFISRNCLDVELLRLSRRAAATRAAAGADNRPPIVVGYASGTRTHDRDFNEACGPALRRVMARHPNVALHVIGPLALDDGWAALRERVVRLDGVDWRDLPALVAGFDVNVAPLEIDNLFCACKSELKWLEAAACGRPTVASATQSFAAALAGVRGDQGNVAGAGVPPSDPPLGLLAATVDDWEAALESLVTDGARRTAIGDAAARWVAAERTTTAQAASFVATLERAMRGVDRPASRVRATGRPAVASASASGRLAVKVLVPEPPPGSGGHTSIFRMVAALCDAGHDVAVHIDRGPLMQGVTEAEAERYIRAHFPPSPAAIRLGRDLGPADVAIATGWTTAAVAAWAPDIGTRLYFVQDYEPFFQPLSADYVAAAHTYRLGLGHITLGPWLAELIETRFGGRARPIDFGVEHDRYGPREAAPESTTPPAAPARPRIVFYARAITPRRGVVLGLEALKRVRAVRPDVDIVLYGGEPRPGLADFPHAQAGVLDAPALAALYHGATVGLALSYTNLSFVPLEMMACGLPVVVARTEPAAWFQRDGVNCAVAEPTAEGLAETLLRVIDDDGLRRTLIAGGRAAVAPLSWERSTRRFVDHVTAYVDEDRAAAANAPAPVPATDGAAAGDSTSGPPRPRRTGPGPVTIARRRLDGWTIGDGGAFALGAGGAAETAWPIRPAADGLYRVDVRFAGVPARGGDGLAVLRLKPHPTAPHDLAVVDVRLDAIVPDAWTSFRFPPLPDIAGRTLWAVLSRLDDAGTGPEPLVLALAARDARADGAPAAGAPLPAHRLWSLDPPPTSAAADPALDDRLADRRRAMREPRRAAGRRARRRLVSAFLDRWAAAFAPLPPLPLRPWPADAPARSKLTAALRLYGPLAVLREARASWRYRSRAGTDGA